MYLSAKRFAKLSTISSNYLNAMGNLAKDWYHQVKVFAVHSPLLQLRKYEYQQGDSYSIHVTERIS